MQLLDEQKKIIDYGEGNLMVSASAGSGKTFVMIERIINLIMSKKAEVKDILAITYVKTAAAELKEKLAEAIKREIERGNDKSYMSEQLSQVHGAAVSTIDSFCANFLRENFYLAKTDPSFSIIDETEAEVLKKRAADELFDEKYEEGSESFLKAVRCLAVRRKDEQMKEHIIKLYDFLSSEEDPERYMRESLDLYGEGFDRAVKMYEEENRGTIEQFIILGNKLLSDERGENLAPLRENLIEALDMLNSLKREGMYSERYSEITLKRLPPIKNLSEEEKRIKERHSEYKRELSEFLKGCQSDASVGYETDRREAAAAGELLKELIELTRRFNQIYSELKEERSAMDFADLERKTSEALTESRELRLLLKNRYKYIFVDEYQDVNGVQENILRCISDSNIFKVGDIKQSIYSFRGCNPEIFADTLQEYKTGDGGEAKYLQSNFRCSDEVIKSVNSVFSRVMEQSLFKVDYLREGMLLSGGLYGPYKGECCLHILKAPTKSREESPRIYSVREESEKAENKEEYSEAGYAASLAASLVGKNFYDVKSKSVRPLKFGDIALLLRNREGAVDELVYELRKLGIPASQDCKKSVTAFPEVKLLIEFLKLVVNEREDIALASVLLSPIADLTEDELLKARKSSEGETLYDSLKAYSQREDQIALKLSKFFEYLTRIRETAACLSASDILWQLMRDKKLECAFAAQSFGNLKMRRVERFIAESEKGDPPLTCSEFLKRVLKAPESLTLSEEGEEDCVKIMSIHSSKGLEFPVVILAGLNKRFNFTDAYLEIVKDRKTGVGVKFYDEDKMIKKDTLIGRLIKKRIKKGVIAEEMRIFYVAMTRAKYALHLLSLKEPEEGSAFKAQCFSDFISEEDFPNVYRRDIDATLPQKRRKLLLSASSDEENIKKMLTFNYPYSSDLYLPMKRSVTQIVQSKKNISNNPSEIKGFTPEEGTAYHRFLQEASFDKISQKEIKEEIIGFVEKGIISDDGAVDENIISAILSSEFFSELRKGKIFREKEFMMNLPSSFVYGRGERNIVVQGIIDLYSVLDDGIILADYKLTKASDDEQIKMRYSSQLNLYQRALESFYKKKVLRKAVVDLRRGRIIEL